MRHSLLSSMLNLASEITAKTHNNTHALPTRKRFYIFDVKHDQQSQWWLNDVAISTLPSQHPVYELTLDLIDRHSNTQQYKKTLRFAKLMQNKEH